MATKRSFPVDYHQLNSLSSVVLYDSASKRKEGIFLFKTDRIIEQRKVAHATHYLICAKVIVLKARLAVRKLHMGALSSFNARITQVKTSTVDMKLK